MGDKDDLINPDQNKDGDQLVDLTQLWPTARPVTGLDSDLVIPPKPPVVQNDGDIKRDGGFYVVDDKGQHIATDKDGNPLPVIDPGTGEIVDPPMPTITEFKANVAEIFDFENTILKATNQAIDDFEKFKNERLENETWIFFAKNKEGTIPYYHSGLGGNQSDQDNTALPEGTYADVIDPDPAKTTDLIQTQNALMQAIGGAIERVGQYAGKLNDAAQLYAGADRAAWID
ncbi:hypothetical protein [Actinoplanes sp. NBRC 103695]|uniref:hypothetical protein n=1 Tax=Actinoplanes sp. NBRC 103695 TaxID=3032202 RepID=UPI0024A0AF5A|nr:hypothetical protein [Actinoplanes sp. NBRC 103695]GLZ01018.1 hypothetical protein Acsp02_82700 [Actinoplanes sp. NBRC 103695]